VRTAILKPVTPKSVYDNGTPEEAEENRRFWSASPSGECTLRYRGDMPFVPGSYYYVDMELGSPQEGDREWRLASLYFRDGNLEVCLNTPWLKDAPDLVDGVLTLVIDNREAWPHFVKLSEDNIPEVGISWRVVFRETRAA